MPNAINTSVSHDDFIPEFVSQKAIMAFTDHTSNNAVAVATNMTPLFGANGGDKIVIPIQPAVTMTTRTEATAKEYLQFSASQVSITRTTEKDVVFIVTDKAEALSNQSLIPIMINQSAASAAKLLDTALAALYGSGGITVTGTTGANITEAELRSAKRQLDAANAPEAGRWLLVSPTQADALSAVSRLSEWQMVGNGGAITMGNVQMAHGFRILKSNNLTATTDGFLHCLAGVASPDPTMSSLAYAFTPYKPLIANTFSLNLNEIGTRATVIYDPLIGGQGVRSATMYGVTSPRTEWLVNIKVTDN